MRLKDTGLTAADIKALAAKYMIETYERMDFLADSAEGIYMYDENGEAYLDFYAGIAVNCLGNCNPKVVAAVQEQSATIMQTFNYPYTVPQAILSKEICETIGMDKVLYQNSGAEANEAMIKLARKWGIENIGPDCWQIITAKKSFHGRTFGSMTATGQPESAIQKGFGDLTPGFVYADFNDLQSFKDAYVKGKTCAIMFEPVQGEGGVWPATEEFIKGIREFCDQEGILMLLDEVQAGWGRCGDFMCYMTYGIKPDIVSMAKAMGGGMPIGGIATTDRVAPAFGPGTHGSTYAGHPVTCAASLAVLRELKAGNWPANAKKVGDYFAEQLLKVPGVVAVRHRGLFVGAVLEDGIDAVQVKRNCIKNHFLVTAIGSSIIRMVPPLTIREVDCDVACERLAKSIAEAK
ncbi:MAG: aminotransferase class III-fold pyridoxal phosphate-dependent enzyme [Evtepia sp.]|uniref:aspartate aminotransferase family protein n=1 Tax=Evtepia sp. TaxID=2773933 RepID=UPI002A74E714|nr:aminotransferase class III-fold pyridoxal phosphate-dependent enzyme [Evtepia sp.]MDY3014348.1 aminotransferase class III-fold pyridoxal phosphate-dependent enzyme [Evtepia sp.]